ncbi:MAG: MBL fold metallo-hydrolase [Saprospiraceae bacterium]|nr:MBL fold metallo-hydrolase [Saprospiraceae bacterium]MBK7736718.1 MBL fold metallo-hydrolase [Saprospiraceae bacterium]MBK7911919.1 MBL fold metallo-hydrolase [Saprospiraceae bacterium]
MKIQKLAIAAIVCATVFFTSCEKSDTNPTKVNFSNAPAASLAPSASVEVVTEDKVRYHVLNFGTRWTSTIVESEKEITLVDVGINNSGGAVIPVDLSNSGAELRAYANAIKKPMNIIITHPHIDHYINLDKFKDVTVYAQTKDAAVLNTDATFNQVYGDTAIGVSGSKEIGGFEYYFDNVSGTEAVENGYVYIPTERAVFTGDLTAIKRHSYIRDYTPLDSVDELSIWINALTDMKSKFSNYKYIFVGHLGYQTNVTGNFDATIAYIGNAQGLIKGTKNLTAGGTATSVQQVVDELKILYPTYGDGALYFSLPNAFYPGDPGAHWF